MRRNMGRVDRGVRALAVAPAAIVAAALVGATSVVGIGLLAFAGVMLVTAAVGFCPLYVPLGINTGGRRHDSGQQPSRDARALRA